MAAAAEGHSEMKLRTGHSSCVLHSAGSHISGFAPYLKQLG